MICGSDGSQYLIPKNPKRYVLSFYFYCSSNASFMMNLCVFYIRALLLNYCSEIKKKCLGINSEVCTLNPEIKVKYFPLRFQGALHILLTKFSEYHKRSWD